ALRLQLVRLDGGRDLFCRCPFPLHVDLEQNALTAEDIADRIGRLCAGLYPVSGTLAIEHGGTRGYRRAVLTDSLDNAAVAWAPAICCNDVIDRQTFPSSSSQAKLDHKSSLLSLVVELVYM